MKRVILTVGAAMLASVPATMGLLHNASLAPRVPVQSPSHVRVVLDDVGRRASVKAGDSTRPARATRTSKVSTNQGSRHVATKHRDDTEEHSAHVKPTDDKGGRGSHVEHRDDKGGQGITRTTKASPPAVHSSGSAKDAHGEHAKVTSQDQHSDSDKAQKSDHGKNGGQDGSGHS